MAKMIDPAPYIKFADAFNEMEAFLKANGSVCGLVLFPNIVEVSGTEFDFGGHYSLEYDSEADRWALVAEADNAPDLCSFNQLRAECRPGDLCGQCQEVQDAMGGENSD